MKFTVTFYIKMELLVETKELDRHIKGTFKTYLIYWNIEEHIIKNLMLYLEIKKIKNQKKFLINVKSQHKQK